MKDFSSSHPFETKTEMGTASTFTALVQPENGRSGKTPEGTLQDILIPPTIPLFLFSTSMKRLLLFLFVGMFLSPVSLTCYG